jgi:SMI1-KNR4 cell-wall
MKIFNDFEISEFWKESDYGNREYVGRSLDEGQIRSAQQKLGYTLPSSYLELLRTQNGGLPARTCHRTSEPTSWADEHVAITGIFGLDPEKSYSLCGDTGSTFWISEWGYPDIGVYFADCPSAGHDMLCLDYSLCGPNGEPRVVHVDQEFEYRITFVAENFEAFIRGLEDEGAFSDT